MGRCSPLGTAERATVVFLAGNSLWLLYLVPSGLLVLSGRIISRLGIHFLRKEILKGLFQHEQKQGEMPVMGEIAGPRPRCAGLLGGVYGWMQGSPLC